MRSWQALMQTGMETIRPGAMKTVDPFRCLDCGTFDASASCSCCKGSGCGGSEAGCACNGQVGGGCQGQCGERSRRTPQTFDSRPLGGSWAEHWQLEGRPNKEASDSNASTRHQPQVALERAFLLPWSPISDQRWHWRVWFDVPLDGRNGGRHHPPDQTITTLPPNTPGIPPPTMTVVPWIPTCTTVEAIPPECCIRVLCATLPTPLQPVAVHCWLEVDGCEGGTSRFEVWQSKDDINEHVARRGSRTRSLGGHVVQDFEPPGAGVGGGDSFEVCRRCEPCKPDYGMETMERGCPEIVGWRGCDCVAKASSTYAEDVTSGYGYMILNSNTFAQHVIDACGMSCALPAKAIGATAYAGPDIAVHGCHISAQLALGTGITVGLDQLSVDVAGMPIGVSEDGIHCIVTIPWPWN